MRLHRRSIQIKEDCFEVQIEALVCYLAYSIAPGIEVCYGVYRYVPMRWSMVSQNGLLVFEIWLKIFPDVF